MVVIRLLGCMVGIDADTEIVDDVLAGLPPAARRPVQGGGPLTVWRAERHGGQVRLLRDGALLGTVRHAEAARLLSSDLELYAAEKAPGRIVFHAGVVAAGGRAIVIPGRSLAGKSTLTAALVRAGAIYYSDEYAVVSPDGRVRGYPRPLSLRPRAGEPASAARRVNAGELGARVGRVAVPVGVVAHLAYRAGAAFSPEPLGPGGTVLALVENAVAAQSRPRAVLRTASRISLAAQGITGTRGDADQAAAELLAMLSI